VPRDINIALSSPYTQSGSLFRVVSIVDPAGRTLRTVDDHQARELLRKRFVVPVWGKKQIIGLKPRTWRDHAADTAEYYAPVTRIDRAGKQDPDTPG
jgi:hypothetical protein